MRRMLSIALGLGVAAAVACSDDGDVGNNGFFVGGHCHDDHDCADQCERGDEYPGGVCTVPCHDDHECPGGTFCVDRDGGVCLLACHTDQECRDGWRCNDQDRQGHGGDASVCIDS